MVLFPMYLRLILWTLVMAYVGFLWVGRGERLVDDITISGALFGAMVGFGLAIMFTRRARRKHAYVSGLSRLS
jgi:membrane associated rhomboid family serine protease